MDLDLDPDPYKKIMDQDPDSGGPKQTDPIDTDPDPQQCNKLFAVIWNSIVYYFIKVRIIFLRFLQHFF